MRRYSSMQRKRKKNRGNQGIELQKKLVRFVLILGAIVLLIIFFFGDHGVYQLYRLNAEKAEIQNAITNLREEKRQLGNEKIRLESDYEYIEELARERYRMAKPGEKVFKVVPKEEDE
jgi:cell division protein FtsB